jgi:aspartyl-tRNA(Asn)/glutamyl-tRNA(Gln) amidotransferase subunit A
MGVDDRTLAAASIRELGRLIRAGEVRPTALAEHALARLDATGRALGAVVTLTRERALREARRAEEELAAGHDRGPLHGIPYGAKDLLATAGIPTTWGAAPFEGQVFARDAAVVRRLETAGAVLVAKLAMVELAGGMGYDHPDAALTGPGLNPWDRSRWSGGSSSGSGAAVGARAVPFAIGSETHGSITTPAAFCGIAGLRPTYGRVSRAGVMALCWTMDKLGPMCRTADDCGLVLAAIAGPDPDDPSAVDRPYRYAPDEEPETGFRLGALAGALDGAQPEVARAYEAALEVLRSFAVLEEVTLPDLPHAAVARIIIAAEASAAFDDLIAAGRVAALRAEADRITPYAYDVVTARDYLRALRVRRHIARAMDALCARFDALVAPTLVRVAPPADESFGTAFRAGGVPIGAAANVAGLPAVTVPCGFGEGGLPVGIQFVGRAFAENRILAVARAYQARTDWHARLPPLAAGGAP